MVDLMQLMPSTAARLGVRERCNLNEKVAGGVFYLAWLMHRPLGDLRLVGRSKKHCIIRSMVENSFKMCQEPTSHSDFIRVASSQLTLRSDRSICAALLVPQAAVNQLQGTYQVTVVGTDNRSQLRRVEVGPRVGTIWVITPGLKPGERVVAVGADQAKEGEVVNPTPYKETEER